MNVFDVEALWHFGNNFLRAGEKGRWVNSVGFSLGFFHYDPYRLNYIDRQSGESKAKWDKRVWENERISLRELGLEGQNFVDGKGKYGNFASSLGLSWQLNYIRERWSFKGELKAVYTSTDYLDDYGPGIWYGGDYERWLNSVLDNPEYAQDPTLFKNVNSPTTKFYNVSGGKDTHLKLAADAPRSTNGLNDWYYQLHIGVSYRIMPLVKRKVIDSMGNIELHMKR
jgi:hypothetical protein